MADDGRLRALMQALALIMRPRLEDAPRLLDAALTLGDLGVDSRHLVELMVACDAIYGAAIPFEMLDITLETTVSSLHNQILDRLGSTNPPARMHPQD